MTTETLAPPNNQEQALDPEVLIQNVVGRVELLLDPTRPYESRFRDLVGTQETPLRPAYLHLPSRGQSVSVMFKDETGHRSRSYKVRGGASIVTAVALEQPDKTGFVGASAGNHANGVLDAVLMHNDLYGTSYTCDMHVSESASPVKTESCAARGATIHQEGNRDLADATDGAKLQALENPELEFASAYDDERVMAGQATLLHETLVQLYESGVDLLHDEIEIVLPFGGGGMAAGCASWLYELQRRGQVGAGIKLVAVQVEDKENCSFVDGTYTKTGEKTAAIRAHLENLGVVSFASVTTTEVANAMQVLAETLGKDVEPAGALATAHVLRDAQGRRDGKRRQEIEKEEKRKKAEQEGLQGDSNETVEPEVDYSDKKYVSVVSGANASRETLAKARKLALADKWSESCGKLALRGMFTRYSRIAAARQLITPAKYR